MQELQWYWDQYIQSIVGKTMLAPLLNQEFMFDTNITELHEHA